MLSVTTVTFSPPSSSSPASSLSRKESWTRWRTQKDTARKRVPSRSPIWSCVSLRTMLYPGYELYRGEVGDGRVVGVRPLGPHGVDQDLAQVEQHGHLSEKSPCRWQQQRCRYIYSCHTIINESGKLPGQWHYYTWHCFLHQLVDCRHVSWAQYSTPMLGCIVLLF